MKNLKRTFKFTKGNIRFVVVSVLMIILVQVLNFLSPLIVKVILDDCIMGIEYNWVEVNKKTDYKVCYQRWVTIFFDDDYEIYFTLIKPTTNL